MDNYNKEVPCNELKIIALLPYIKTEDTKVYPERKGKTSEEYRRADKALNSLFGQNNYQISYIINEPLTFLHFKYMNEDEKRIFINRHKEKLLEKIKISDANIILILFMPHSFGNIFDEFIFELKEKIRNKKIIYTYNPRYAFGKRLANMTLKEYKEHILGELKMEGILVKNE